jgi:4'-phosphopantetheinyl transferase
MLARLNPVRQPLDRVIELWFLDLDRILPVDPGRVLSPAEEERAGRFMQARHALHYRNSHLLLRFGLAWHLGIAPSAVRWQPTARGKPMLPPETGLFFNLSHCDHFAVAALTSYGEVGVDIEPAGRMVETEEIAGRYFAAEEARWIGEAATSDAKADRFLRLWTRKEAVMKATGTGLSDALLAAHMLGDLVTLPDGSGRLARWRVEDLTLPFPAVAAVAAPEGRWSTRSFRIEPEDFSRLAEPWR